MAAPQQNSNNKTVAPKKDNWLLTYTGFGGYLPACVTVPTSTMEDTFYFALLRISVAQILKASGFDKCKSSVLNVVTDLYIKHLQLVLTSAHKFSTARGSSSSDLDASDVIQALLDVEFLKPQTSDVPSQDDDRVNTKSLDSFLKWTKYSDSFAVAKKLSTVPTPLLYNLMEKRKVDTSLETDQEKKRRRLRERQEFYNQLKQGEDTAMQDGDDALIEDLDDEELTAGDKLSWLAYLTEKDMKLGQNMKFVDSCIQDYLKSVHKNKKFHPSVADTDDSSASFDRRIHNNNKNDYVLLQLQDVEENNTETDEHAIHPSDELKKSLPYNIKYNEVLLDDDLNQYIEYASSHQDEILERLEELEKLRAFVPEKSPESVSENTDTDSNIITNQVVEKIGAEAFGDDLSEALAALPDPEPLPEIPLPGVEVIPEEIPEIAAELPVKNQAEEIPEQGESEAVEEVSGEDSLKDDSDISSEEDQESADPDYK